MIHQNSYSQRKCLGPPVLVVCGSIIRISAA
uniref:Uncharacterized protein n=1 Tax=Rhizophora mucronata TaxID=61149 RepID=A0A2P2N869_RHIMU